MCNDMRYRDRSFRTGQRRAGVYRRLEELEDEFEATRDRVRRLENTLRGVVRNVNDVSVGGPCTCGKSLLIVRQQEIYCPQCGYQRTM